MDDEIIHYWCFLDVECFDSIPSAVIIILDKDLESFLSLRSQQMWPWSWGIGDRYLEQMRRAEPRKQEEKERRERVEEGELKDRDRQRPPREGSQAEEMQR